MYVIPPRHLFRLLPSFMVLGLLASESLAAKPPRALEAIFVVAAREPAWQFQATSSSSGAMAIPLGTGGTLGIGSTVGTGEGGMMRLLLGGHTVVDLGPQTVVGFPGADRAKGKNSRAEERIVVLRGAARTFTDADYLPTSTTVSLIGGKRKQTSQGGYLTVQAATTNSTPTPRERR